MVDLKLIASLLEDIVANDRIQETDIRFEDPKSLCWIQHQPGDGLQDIFLSSNGRASLIRLMQTLRDDRQITRHIEYEDLLAATESALLQSAQAFDAGTLHVDAQARDLYDKLTADVTEWHVLMSVPGLRMAPGDVVSIAGLQFGTLKEEERNRIQTVAEQVGRRQRLRPEDPPGTALPRVMKAAGQLLTADSDDDCWAWGIVSATKISLARVVDERINMVALNVMRCFAFQSRQGPERLSLGEPTALQVRRRLWFEVDNPSETFVGERSRFTDRTPFVLSRPFLSHLQTTPTWERAVAIVEPSRQRSDLEEAVFRAMLQFGTTSSLQFMEMRLTGYLSALEALLLGYDDYSNHEVKIGRRLSALIGGDIREFIVEMYQVRQGPVHRSERNIEGTVVVLEEEVASLCHVVYQAIMASLDRCATTSTRQRMLEDLDAGAVEPQSAWPKYAFVVHTVLDGQEYTATCPDFPGSRGTAHTPRDAQERARLAVDARVRQLLQTGEPLPACGTVEVNRLPVWTPTNETEKSNYLSRATQLEQAEHNRLLHIAGGTLSAQDAADQLGSSLHDLEARRVSGTIIGLPVDGRFVYPIWQFDGDGVLAGLPEVLHELDARDPWAQAAFLHTRVVGNVTLLLQLRTGRREVALREARLLHDQGGAWFRVKPARNHIQPGADE